MVDSIPGGGLNFNVKIIYGRYFQNFIYFGSIGIYYFNCRIIFINIKIIFIIHAANSFIRLNHILAKGAKESKQKTT